MVQAAAQAQAVVAAAKSRGDGLVPMNAAQIAALSQIQAQAIVHARKTNGTPQQIQTQIQLQAQALVHAHTQAQIGAGIYKGEASKEPAAATVVTSTVTQRATAPASTTTTTIHLTPSQQRQQMALKERHNREKAALQPGQTTGLAQLLGQHKTQMENLLASFQLHKQPTTSTTLISSIEEPVESAPSATSPQFLAKLQATLNSFWTEQLQLVQQLPSSSTEQDFKTHNDLPLARIKRIMKSDEDVRMISAEAPVLFAKACELFILELTLRSWSFSQHHKRRTLQKEDIKEAIQRTDIFDFLVDVIQ